MKATAIIPGVADHEAAIRSRIALLNTSESPTDERHDDDAACGGESEVAGVRKELLLSGSRRIKNLPGRSHMLKKDVLTVFTTKTAHVPNQHVYQNLRGSVLRVRGQGSRVTLNPKPLNPIITLNSESLNPRPLNP